MRWMDFDSIATVDTTGFQVITFVQFLLLADVYQLCANLVGGCFLVFACLCFNLKYLCLRFNTVGIMNNSNIFSLLLLLICYLLPPFVHYHECSLARDSLLIIKLPCFCYPCAPLITLEFKIRHHQSTFVSLSLWLCVNYL